jgi:hypothetical protein
MSDFTGFGVVLETVVTIGLIVGWGQRRSSGAADDRSSGVAANVTANNAPNNAANDAKVTQRQMFEQLQTLLVNYPSVSQAAMANPTMPAKNIVPLFTPLGNLVRQWGYVAIGQPWEAVEYDPQWHQPDVPDIQPGERVYVRFIGYRDGNDILVPAKVSRTLPLIP